MPGQDTAYNWEGKRLGLKKWTRVKAWIAREDYVGDRRPDQTNVDWLIDWLIDWCTLMRSTAGVMESGSRDALEARSKHHNKKYGPNQSMIMLDPCRIATSTTILGCTPNSGTIYFLLMFYVRSTFLTVELTTFSALWWDTRCTRQRDY